MMTKQGRKHTVLWADDDPDDLMIMREALQFIDHDHMVKEVSNGREALNYLSTLHDPEAFPCLIILDNNMPVLNGTETLAEIKKDKKYSDIPVIIFTTSCSERDRNICNQLGAKMYTKPHTLAGLKKTIAELLTHCNYKVESPVQ